MANKDKSTTIEGVLKKEYVFRYNEVKNKLTYKQKRKMIFKDLNEYDLNSITRNLRKIGFKNISKAQLIELLNSDFTPKINPFEDYFKRLPEWKSGDPDFIQELLKTIQVSEKELPNWEKWFKKWIVALVACAIDDNVVNQTALILIGNQGIGKTTWLERLIPEKLREYIFSGTIQPGNKDAEIHLSENILINLDELENLNRKNLGNLKALLTRGYINIRRPYAARSEEMPRRASFAGSTNSREFLSDETGNRRFLCFEALSIHLDLLATIDMDKVYSQAYFLYRDGFQYWFDNHEISIVNEHNETYRYVPLEQELLLQYFEKCSKQEEADFIVTTTALAELLYAKAEINRRISLKSLGSALKAMGWPKIKKKGNQSWLVNEKKSP